MTRNTNARIGAVGSEEAEARREDSDLAGDESLTGEDAPGAETLAETDRPEADRIALDKRELIARVVERCGVKKREAKPTVEAALAILGEALAEGRDLRLEPLGKLKVSDIKSRGDKRVIDARLRQNAGSAVADAAEGALNMDSGEGED